MGGQAGAHGPELVILWRGGKGGHHYPEGTPDPCVSLVMVQLVTSDCLHEAVYMHLSIRGDRDQARAGQNACGLRALKPVTQDTGQDRSRLCFRIRGEKIKVDVVGIEERA